MLVKETKVFINALRILCCLICMACRYRFSSVFFAKKFPLITKDCLRLFSNSLHKGRRDVEFGSGGGEYKDCIVDNEGSIPAVSYTQYNRFV